MKVRTGKDIQFERPGFDPFPIRDLGLDIFSMSRPLLEAVTRRRVQQTPNINVCERSRATGLVASRDATRIEAVRYDSQAVVQRRWKLTWWLKPPAAAA